MIFLILCSFLLLILIGCYYFFQTKHVVVSPIRVAQKVQEQSVDDVIKRYLNALEDGHEEAILEIGKMYLHGIHPYYLPDTITAGKIFTEYSKFSSSLQPWCKLYLQRLSYSDLDTLPQHNISYKYLPHNILSRINASVHKMKHLIPYSAFFDNSWIRQDRPHILPKQHIKNDKQNVHDHTIQDSALRVIYALQNKYNNNIGTFVDNLHDVLQQHVDKDVIRVCETLTDNIHSKYNLSEKDIFNMIWTHVKHDPNKVEMFLTNLKDCIEFDHVVCSTGKIMRMISTLDVIDPDTPDLKPEWMVKEEIATIISNTLQKLTDKERKEYESENDEHIKQVIKDRVLHKCKEDYSANPTILETYVNDYLQYI